MRSKHLVVILGLAIVIVVVIILLYPRKKVEGKLDDFAKCLAGKGVTMYGTDWCLHCQNEKKAFGDSFRLVPYVECPNDPQKCLAAGVNGYPTWVWPDGKKLEGEQGIEKLSRESGCSLITPAEPRG